MTVEIPATGSRAWREIYPVPPQLRLGIGPWCPIDDGALTVERHGWLCPRCLAWWDRTGGHPTWVADGPAVAGDIVHVVDLDEQPGTARPWWRSGRVLAAGAAGVVVLGGGFAAGRAVHPVAELLPRAWLWAVSLGALGAVLAGLGLVWAWNLWQDHIAAGEVRDER